MKKMIKNLALILVFSLLFTSNSSAYYYMSRFNYFAKIERIGDEFEIEFFDYVLNTKENISFNNIYITDQNFNKLDDLTGLEFEEYKIDTIDTLEVYFDDMKLESDKIYYLVVDKNILLENGEKLGVDIKKPFKVNALYNEYIDIKDKNLEYAIKQELDDIDKISMGDLSDVYELSLSNFNKFTDLKEILYLKNLQFLEFKNIDFSNWDNSDYELLKELNEVCDYINLTLIDCTIKDFDLIQKNFDLYSLSIDNCEIKNIKNILDFKNIECLKFINSDLTEFDLEEDFSKEDNLNEIVMENCEVKNLKFLKNFNELEFLEIENSNFDMDGLDIAFENKNRLRTLKIANSNIDNIDFIKELKMLHRLEVYGNAIEDISVLENIKDLSSIDISGNKITNIDVLEKLNEIDSLDIGYNDIEDLFVLEKLKELDYLGVSKVQMDSIKRTVNLDSNIYIDVY